MLVEEPKPGYYGIITAEVRYDENLSPLEKLLFAEVTALCNKQGFCWASNKYFAELYQRNERYISGVLNKLKAKGYLTIEVNRANGNSRKIWIAIQKNLNTYSEKAEDPYSEKPEDNTIVINTIKNTIIKKELPLFSEIENSDTTTPCPPPQKKENSPGGGAPEIPSFDDFWNLYGKKVGRDKCAKKWGRLSQHDKEKIMEHLPAYIAATPEIMYRKNPETFLNNKSWNDEIINAKRHGQQPKRDPRREPAPHGTDFGKL